MFQGLLKSLGIHRPGLCPVEELSILQGHRKAKEPKGCRLCPEEGVGARRLGAGEGGSLVSQHQEKGRLFELLFASKANAFTLFELETGTPAFIGVGALGSHTTSVMATAGWLRGCATCAHPQLSHTGKESPELGLKLCHCHLEILNSISTRGPPVSLCSRPRKLCSWF